MLLSWLEAKYFSEKYEIKFLEILYKFENKQIEN